MKPKLTPKLCKRHNIPIVQTGVFQYCPGCEMQKEFKNAKKKKTKTATQN
jgi:hypothetical protein